MTYAFIREGDTTSHGGRVLACTSTNMMFGKPVALLGDMVACPKCGGVYSIVDVKVSSMTFGGATCRDRGRQDGLRGVADRLARICARRTGVGRSGRNRRRKERCPAAGFERDRSLPGPVSGPG